MIRQHGAHSVRLDKIPMDTVNGSLHGCHFRQTRCIGTTVQEIVSHNLRRTVRKTHDKRYPRIRVCGRYSAPSSFSACHTNIICSNLSSKRLLIFTKKLIYVSCAAIQIIPKQKISRTKGKRSRLKCFPVGIRPVQIFGRVIWSCVSRDCRLINVQADILPDAIRIAECQPACLNPRSMVAAIIDSR